MKNILLLISIFSIFTGAFTAPVEQDQQLYDALSIDGPPPPADKPHDIPENPKDGPGSYTMEQTLSDNAQLQTIAFDGLAFITGDAGTDSFFPPGKMADFWGFQYLRDNDLSEMGHNTDFLTKASLNTLQILTVDQRERLIKLAEYQVDEINQYAYQRFVLMTAFRQLLENDLPGGTTGLDEEAVIDFSAALYRLDGKISYERAKVMGSILFELSDDQISNLDDMVEVGMSSWPEVDEVQELRALSRDEKIAVMTYAGDLFSWYAGSIEADVYFCPERQGTYFGSFYLKDAPAVGNPGYSIGTNITADMGQAFIDTLSIDQLEQINSLVEIQRPYLDNIVIVRQMISEQLRLFMDGDIASEDEVLALMEMYGEYDGAIVYHYATTFASIENSMTSDQLEALYQLRSELVGGYTPAEAYLYSQSIEYPEIMNVDFLFK